MLTEENYNEEQQIRHELAQQIRSELDYIFARRSLVELRAIKGSSKYKETASGYFTKPDAMAEYAMDYNLDGYQVYYTLNEVDSGILTQEIGVKNGSLTAKIGAMIEPRHVKPHPLDDNKRTRVTKNRMWYRPKKTTEGVDITKRLALLVDFDPERDEGNATDAEWQHALEVANACVAHLTSVGWPAPWVASSGNGIHLLWDIDLEVSDETDRVIQRCLVALAQRFSNTYVKVDTGVYDRSRICKVPGTWAVKADDTTPERPWRQSHTISVPSVRVCVSRALLDALADEAHAMQSTQKRTSEDPRLQNIYAAIRRSKSAIDPESWLRKWLEDHDIDYGRKESVPTGHLWRLKECPFQLHYEGCNHQEDYVAYVTLSDKGVFGAGCFKGGCKAFIEENRADKSGWKTLRDIVEPGWEERREEHKKQKAGRPKKKTKAELQELLDEEERETLTDTGNARRLILHHGVNIRYTSKRGWLVWDDRRWKLDDDGQVERCLKDTAHRIVGEAYRVEDDDLRDAIIRHAMSSLNQTRLDAAKKNAMTEPEVVISHGTLDADPLLFNVLNGAIDLRTGEVRQHFREDYLTKLAQVTYDPLVFSPYWEQFLLQIFCGDEELVNYIQRLFGYALTGLNTEQCMFIMHGNGANGKSKLLEVLQLLVGDYGAQTDFNTFMLKQSDTVRNDLAQLVGCRVVCGAEGDIGHHISEAVVKQVTGGDPIVARFLYKEPFTYQPQFKIFLATNHLPKITGQDTGIWRRLRVIPFNYTIPEHERNPHLVSDFLLPELSGILNWALAGWSMFQDIGEQIPSAVASATAEYRRDMDPFGEFIDDCFDYEGGAETLTQIILEMLRGWGTANNSPLAKLSARGLAGKMEEKGIGKSPSTKRRGYVGLTPKPLALRRYTTSCSGLNIADLGLK